MGPVTAPRIVGAGRQRTWPASAVVALVATTAEAVSRWEGIALFCKGIVRIRCLVNTSAWMAPRGVPNMATLGLPRESTSR